jgi:hypothetical protein
MALGDCTGYVDDDVSEWGRAHAIAPHIPTVLNRVLHTLWDAKRHILFSAKLVLAELRSHEVGRHLIFWLIICGVNALVFLTWTRKPAETQWGWSVCHQNFTEGVNGRPRTPGTELS